MQMIKIDVENLIVKDVKKQESKKKQKKIDNASKKLKKEGVQLDNIINKKKFLEMNKLDELDEELEKTSKLIINAKKE